MPDLSIIIVNWNSASYLDTCIRTIRESTRELSYEIIVVDNASYDGSEAVARRHGDSVRFVQSDENLGFARANNLGFHHSGGKTLLFLNPDTEIRGDALVRMNDFLSRLSDAGCLGCRILNSDGTVQTSCVQAFPTITNQLLDAEFLRNLFPKSGLWGMGPLYEANGRPLEVEAIAGSCMMVRRDIFEKAGLFSEEYFMFAEDLDLCYKMRQFGYRNYYYGGASVVHHGGGSTKSTGKGSFSDVLIRESVKKFLKKFYGETYSILYVLTMQLASVTRILILLIIYPVSLLSVVKRKNLDKALNKWRSIFFWSMGMESWAKRS